ncbi:hypothetical protein JOB18_048048 [Solea senegalensis]|uniref:Uncharacterized protein n=1 Tax=Solea senegalensis TaxID=28829 RepID=A0AAV6S0F5_SOLSE|nr:hypothetical protein JOB18_048048 [Solea senegalensis]
MQETKRHSQDEPVDADSEGRGLRIDASNSSSRNTERSGRSFVFSDSVGYFSGTESILPRLVEREELKNIVSFADSEQEMTRTTLPGLQGSPGRHALPISVLVRVKRQRVSQEIQTGKTDSTGTRSYNDKREEQS